MKTYIAAMYSRRVEMLDYAGQLTRAGHTVTSRWLNGTHEAADGDKSQWGDFASDDLEDISKAECLILFTETHTPPRNSRMVEMGYALGIGVRVVVVGPIENVFCQLPDVLRYASWEDLAAAWKLSVEVA